MMKRAENSRLILQGITAFVLFGLTFVASADQAMHALPKPTSALPAVQSTALPAVQQPVAQPPGPLTKPMSQSAPSAPPMNQMKLPPLPQGRGMAQLGSDAACGLDNTPRIGSVNGRSSGGFDFKPGDTLNIGGCGFGSAGQVYLSVGVGVAVPLIVDTWNDSNIHAHIDVALGGVPDVGVLNVHVKPNGTAELASAGGSSFHAVRETNPWALPPALGKYSQVYGQPTATLSSDGKATVVERKKDYTNDTPFCPAVTNQEAQMQDIWKLDGSSFKPGFKIESVDYKNMTNQVEADNLVEEDVLVGQNGSAYYLSSAKSIIVTFQGHSIYTKKSWSNTIPDSLCTSRYTVSAIISGPRGISPFK
jgi:hypothetical protein